ncbi:polyprenol monophosphomannose synthase [bacterium]|jgi:dolichol-phosphate mannosyltransferase|nr:polyprenol monophosphomannose synthase [bacterium]
MSNLVLIPTYNEAENIPGLVKAISSLTIPFDILIIDDNSPDGTASIVKGLMPEYHNLHILERPGKAGLGRAYIAGFDWALQRDYKFICEMDADFSHDPADLVRLWDACENGGADLAIGSRYISGVNVVNWPMGRVLMSYIASMYVRIITGMKIMDTTAGFKCYRRDVLLNINPGHIRLVGYGFQIEMKFTAWRLGYKIVEVPIIFTDRRAGTSKMSGSIFGEAMWGVLRMKISSFFRKPRRIVT